MSDGGNKLNDVRCTLVSVENQLLRRLNDRAEAAMGGDGDDEDELEDGDTDEDDSGEDESGKED